MTEPTAQSRSSFYLAMRVLPKDQREAMFSIYRFCRAVDDVADEPQFGSRPRARERACQMARGYRTLSSRDSRGRRSPTSRARSAALPCGAKISRPSSPGSRWTPKLTFEPRTGRRSISTAIAWRAPWGAFRCGSSALARRREMRCAFHLGRALQLTNILRDLDEDAAVGRLYCRVRRWPPRASSHRRSSVGGQRSREWDRLRRGRQPRPQPFQTRPAHPRRRPPLGGAGAPPDVGRLRLVCSKRWRNGVSRRRACAPDQVKFEFWERCCVTGSL